MQAAALPANEAERLASLRSLDILDTAAEPEFDELVALAAALCGTPIGLVSLVDEDRQWFKSTIGLTAPETPRCNAFCAHAILQESIFIIEDATADDRFADNPLVTGDPNIRFYAGIPIDSPNGLPVGTLCVCDTVPRHLAPEQRQALKVLGHQINGRLELRSQRIGLQQALVEKQQMLDALRKTQIQLEHANQRLEALASTDALTGLRNRRVFDERFAEEYERARRNGHALCVAMLDIDNFKSRNDQFGHPAGDAALRKLGELLSTSVRRYDLVARYGGEEFVILMPETDRDQACLILSRILEAIRSAVWPDRPLTVSIGLADLGSAMDKDVTQFMDRADQALYLAKGSGKDRLCCASLA